MIPGFKITLVSVVFTLFMALIPEVLHYCILFNIWYNNKIYWFIKWSGRVRCLEDLRWSGRHLARERRVAVLYFLKGSR